MRLLNKTLDMLRQYLDEDAADALGMIEADELLLQVARLLQSCRIAEYRRLTVLGCYVLICLAIQKHRELVLHDNKALTRGILDGDYLIGLYYRMMSARREWRLIAHLAPFQKKWQWDLMNGCDVRAVRTELHDELRMYLDQQCA